MPLSGEATSHPLTSLSAGPGVAPARGRVVGHAFADGPAQDAVCVGCDIALETAVERSLWGADSICPVWLAGRRAEGLDDAAILARLDAMEDQR